SYRYAETVWAGAVTGARTAPPPDSPLSFEMDDSSNLILSHVGEMVGGAGRPFEINNFSSNHPTGAMYLFARGHARFLTGSTNYQTLKGLATRAGGETLAGDF